MKALIDIIIPAYNAHNTIERTLFSIATQTMSKQVNVIIINDGSKQDYSKIVKDFSKYISIKEITLNKNVGCGRARQIGLDNATAKYIMFMDADDLLASPVSIYTLYTNIEKNDYNIVYGKIHDVRLETGQYIEIPSDHFTWIFGSIYKRKFIEDNKIVFNDSSRGEDTGFNKLCKLLSEKEKVCFLDCVTYLWTDSNDNRINNTLHFKELYSKIGFIENMFLVYEMIKDRNVKFDESFMKFDMLGNFAMFFYQLIEVNNLENLSQEQKNEFLFLIKKFYDKHFVQYLDKITIDDISLTFRVNDEKARKKYNIDASMNTTEIQFYEFLKMLHNLEIDK